MLRALILAMLSISSVAQADLADGLKTCAAMTDAPSRLACFDALGRITAADTVPDNEPAPSVPVAPAPAPIVAPTAAPASPASSDDVDSFGLDAEDARIEAVSSAEQRAAEAERKALAQQVAAEQKKQEREQVVTASIRRVIRHHDERFSVVLDNGQVWRETQGSRVRTPRTGASVELMRGRVGGYRMKIDGVPRLAWVKRTK